MKLRRIAHKRRSANFEPKYYGSGTLNQICKNMYKAIVISDKSRLLSLAQICSQKNGCDRTSEKTHLWATNLSQRNGGRSTNDHAANRSASVIAHNVVSLVEHGRQALQGDREEPDAGLGGVVAENAEQERSVRARRTVLVLETSQGPLSKLCLL